MNKIVILTGLAALSACDTTTILVPTSLAPATGTAGSAMTGSVPAAANAGDPIAITIAGTPLVGVIRNPVHDRGGFRAFSSYTISGSAIEFSYLGHGSETSTGEMTASVAASSALSPTNFDQAATYSRISPTTLPTNGTANYTGQYIGSFGEPHTPLYRVTGDAALSADFGAATISGSITNRFLDGPFVQYSTSGDVTLGTTAIDAAGAFSGTATGGAMAALPALTDVSGNWSGLIGGATGNQIAGAVQITKRHPSISLIYTETGVFLAE